MDFKKLMQQAKQMQAELQNKMEEYDAKLFHFEYQNLVAIDIYGSLKIKSIQILDKAIVDVNDLDNMTDVIAKCVDNAITAIVKGKTEITNKIAGPAAEGLF